MSGLVVLFLLFDGAIKLVPLQVVIDTVVPLGWPTDPVTWRALGIVLIASALLYAYPRTAFLGAILITAYLGGAVATHVRVGSSALQPHPVRRLYGYRPVGRALAARSAYPGAAALTFKRLPMITRVESPQRHLNEVRREAASKLPSGDSTGELNLHPVDDHAVAACRLGPIEG